MVKGKKGFKLLKTETRPQGLLLRRLPPVDHRGKRVGSQAEGITQDDQQQSLGGENTRKT